MTHSNDPSIFARINQQVEETVVHKDTGRGGWSTTHWLKDVFELNPALVSLAEKHDDGGSFAFNFIITVKTPDGFRHRLLEWQDFHCNYIRHAIETFVENYPNVSSYWLDGVPSAANIRAVVNRRQFGFGDADGSFAASQKQKVLEENREWMERVFNAFAGVSRIVKSANTSRSPTTFALCLEQGRPHHTWMKAPSFDKVRVRMKVSMNALRSSEPREIWVPGPVPTEQAGIEFTREDFYPMTDESTGLPEAALTPDELAKLGRFKLRILANKLGLIATPECKDAFHAMDNVAAANFLYEKMHQTETKEDQTQKVEDIQQGLELEPPPCCTSCGADLKTNLQFGRGEEKLCGECELKHDEENGSRRVHLEFVFKRRRLVVPKRNTRFDPRPGIDDVGLGGSGPGWED